MPHLRWPARSYHAWVSMTPVADALICVLAVASVVIGTYAGLFLMLAISVGDRGTAIDNALILLAIAVANALADLLRHWRRHHA